MKAPAFEPTLSKDEKLLVIARPHGTRWSVGAFFTVHMKYAVSNTSLAKIEGRDGYSGSPVYNQKAEIVGVFSGYDWTQKLAVISPGMSAQKLLEDYVAAQKQ